MHGLSILFWVLLSGTLNGQSWNNRSALTSQDTLRGSITPGRSWWNIIKYDILIQPDFINKTIAGENIIHFKVLKNEHAPYLQIDLQAPLLVDSIWLNDTAKLNFRKDLNVYQVNIPHLNNTVKHKLHIYYHGSPHEAVMPPWDGGWVWTKDSLGRPWMTVACQGIGASTWYPCKDHLSDEPDEGATLSIVVPDTLQAVANGRLELKAAAKNGTAIYTWEVNNPINNYNIIPYIGKYVNLSDRYKGEEGSLDMNFWVLDYNIARAKTHLIPQAKLALKCFEFWFGPYPFYRDGYKLVDAPGYGMEHQSAIAYGNGYQFGHKGKDYSGTGWVKKWDFLIVHETAHEWFGNSITVNDLADKWVHEAFAAYAEVLYTNDLFGKEAGNAYAIGTRKMTRNNSSVVGRYGINEEGSSDMFSKGRNMLHTIRQIINSDNAFREILRSMNREFYHRIVTTKGIENFISKKSGYDLSFIFNQYLRTTQIPLLEYELSKRILKYRFARCIDGFSMPVKIYWSGEKWITPTTQWQQLTIKNNPVNNEFRVDNNFYVELRQLNP